MNKIGALIKFRPETDIFLEMEKAKNIGCECCQISVWDMSLYTDENARKISDAANKYNLEISTLWVGWSGPK